MSIYTEEAERRSKPAVVAECWTCWECSEPWNTWEPHSCEEHKRPTMVDMALERVSPRHAGHDVRPVKSNR